MEQKNNCYAIHEYDAERKPNEELLNEKKPLTRFQEFLNMHGLDPHYNETFSLLRAIPKLEERDTNVKTQTTKRS